MKKRLFLAVLILVFWAGVRFILVEKDKQLTSPKTFIFKYPDYAEKVYITGSFNNWNYEDTDYEMEMSRCLAKIILKLEPSIYEYKFYVKPKQDTVKRWFSDEHSAYFEDDGYGGKNSVIKLQQKTKIVITFKAPEYAKEVYLTGDFDDWKFNKYPMEKMGNQWTTAIELVAGRYAYKFVVNPKEIAERESWFIDPAAKQTPKDEYGKTNSIVEIKTLKNFMFFFDIFFIALVSILTFSSIFAFLTEKIMQLKLKLTVKLVFVIVLVVFITSFILIFIETRERETTIKNQFRIATNIMDAWLFSTCAELQTPYPEQKLKAVLENMMFSSQESGSRFNTGIKAAAIYNANGEMLVADLSKIVEERVKGESDILSALKKLKPQTTEFKLHKILKTDIVAILPVKRGLKSTIQDKIEYYLVVDYDWIRFKSERNRYIANKFFALFIVVVISGVIAFVLSSALLSPIKKLDDAMTKVHSGDYTQKVDIKTKDELQDLAQTFNFMTHEIKRYRDMQIDKIIEEQTKTEAIIFSIEDGIILTDFKGNIILCNEQIKRHFGIAHILSEGKNINTILPYPEIISAIEEVTKSPQKRVFKEIEVKFPSYSRFFRTDSIPVKTKKNEYIGTATVVHDITLEKELDEMKMNFFQAITHDLKTPITAIVGYLDILRTEKIALLTSEEKRILNIMKVSTQKLKDLVQNILDVAKIEAGKPLLLDKKRFDLKKMILQLIELFKPDLETFNLKMETNISSDIPEILADEKQIERVVSNLISNAAKFTPPAGKICINANLVQSSEFRVQSEKTTSHEPRTTNYIRVSVSDTGSGIPQDYLDKIFDKFQQVKGTEKRGTGLGLTICRHIIEAHGGNIRAESVGVGGGGSVEGNGASELSKGSKFIFEIPV
ncbi:MAG: HAMP domain-containing protein [Elusimicrobia bacterium]|nr:HAMP domain-containing protein [Elusimicrobiota bacterium]